jgi:DNA-binding transcriptional regulator WhiA
MLAIAAIEAKPGGLSGLPAKLREAAEIRKGNPEASLSDMGAMFDPPVSKSAVAARLKRLCQAQMILSQKPYEHPHQKNEDC